MNEPTATHGDGDVRRARLSGREEQQIARRKIAPNFPPYLELLAYTTRQCNSVLCKDVLGEAAAIKSGWIGSTVEVSGASKVQRRADERVEIRAATGNGRLEAGGALLGRV